MLGIVAPVVGGVTGASVWVSESTGMQGFVERFDTATLDPDQETRVEGTNGISVRLADGLVWVTQVDGGRPHNFCGVPSSGRALGWLQVGRASQDEVLAIGPRQLFYALPTPSGRAYVEEEPAPTACHLPTARPSCTAGEMTASSGGNAYLGAGQDIDAVLLTNASAGPCSIGGFPVVSFIGNGATKVPGLVPDYAAAGAHMDIPTAFQRVSPMTFTRLQPGQSVALYYTFNTRATSSTCVMEHAALRITWTGSDGAVRFPTVAGLFTVEACAGEHVTFSQIGPAEARVFVANR